MKRLSVPKNLLNSILIVIPVLMSILALVLFCIRSREEGLEIWRLARNIVIVGYLVILPAVFVSKTNNNKLLSFNAWIIGLICSIFSWAIGGFIFDLIKLVQIINGKIG